MAKKATTKKGGKTLDELLSKYGDYIYTGDALEKLTPRIHKTPFPSLNLILGGGFFMSRLHHIYAEKSCGKTSLAVACVSNCEGLIGFVDAEGTMTVDYLEEVLGVHRDKIVLTKPFTMEQALEQVIDLLGLCDFVILDSVAGTKAKSTTEKAEEDIGHEQIAATARLLSTAMSQVTDAAFVTRGTPIFLNQLRINPGMAGLYDDGARPTGGKTIPFESTIEMRLTAAKDMKGTGKDKWENGVYVTIRLDKHKLGIKGKKAKLKYVHGVGFLPEYDYLNLAVEWDIVQKGGSWYSFEEAKLGQGEDKVVQFFKDNPELYQKIKDAVDAQVEFELNGE